MFGKREDEGIPLYSLQQAEMNIYIYIVKFGKREDEGIPLYSLQQAEMNIYIYIVKFIYALRLELFFKISL